MASKSVVVFLLLSLVASSAIAQAPGPSPTRSPLPSSSPPPAQSPKTTAPTPSIPPPSVTPTASPMSPPAGSPIPSGVSPPAPSTTLSPDGSPLANAPSDGPGGSNPVDNNNNAVAVSAGSLVGFVIVASLLL